jgi:hypothetical protein
MREAYAHQAQVEMAGNGDERAPGAAVTVALCGHWDHDPPCTVPHRTEVVARDGNRVTVRVLFACAPDDAAGVRAGVARALAAGLLPVPAPDGAPATSWRVIEQVPVELTDQERAVAARLAADPQG